MRAIIQRVGSASVTIDHTLKAAIGKGLLVLAGIEDADTEEDVRWLAGKITQLRIFNDAQQVANLSVKDIQGEILLISQFTLFASTKKGNRPSYLKAGKPNHAKLLYEKTIQALEKELNNPVQTGLFGADMKVALVNDGPVTIIIDTKNRE